ncbi:MAG: polysaccharide biosynthesis protein [Planctomycetaceae bacterium]|jgi:FlaA1/EpsC-like NDP-sugar epimerase|nr:polysaccharide biosynthesis protein [Planctomycetaceae bacterium]
MNQQRIVDNNYKKEIVDMSDDIQEITLSVEAVKKNNGGILFYIQWIGWYAFIAATYLSLFAVAYLLAFAFRYDFNFNDPGIVTCYKTIGWIVCLKAAVFFYHRHFHSCWMQATFKEFLFLCKSAVYSSVAIFVVSQYIFEVKLPRTVPVMDCIFTITLIGGIRFGWRFFREEIQPWLSKTKRIKTIIIGSDLQLAELAHDLRDRPELGYQIIGFLSTSDQEVGQQYGHIPVIGTIDQIEKILFRFSIKEVLTCPGIVHGDRLRNILMVCQKYKVHLRIVPPIETRLGNSTIPMRDIRIEDLLKRDPNHLDNSTIERMLTDQTILVTGAGGSIGSEICRQIIKFCPKKIIILGRGENRIFFLEKELLQLGFCGKLVTVIADVTRESRIERVLQEHKPQVIFHAAAHKHVPLMESNISEAVYNNIKGTKTIADLASKYQVLTFVQISTDKAVNPTSVMGATKHLAERYVHALASTSKTKFIVTRFGNVLGSTGSVVPIFRKQIAEGGPITITDYRMSRYFMTIPEASQLVLQAAAMGSGGEIFVMDMGEPVKIIDLAKDLIRLSGLPDNAIEIRETGIRQGEKLYEELYFNSEKAIRTSHEKLRCASHRRFDWNNVREQIDELLKLIDEPDHVIQMKLCETIEEYDPESQNIHKSKNAENNNDFHLNAESKDLRKAG